MRLKSLSIAGFRGFPRPVTLDLDADAVIVAGVNGSGKTSLFDAVLWALSGSIDRLSDETVNLVSRYSPSGEARVEAVLSSDNDSTATVIRRFDGKAHLSVQRGSDPPVTGPAAEAALIELLWPDAKSSADPLKALTRSLTRATYLQQDSVRQFVEADTEQERFQVVGDLVGVGRIAELQRQLESSKNSWTRATTTLERDLDPFVTQRTVIRERVNRLQSLEVEGDIQAEYANWRQAVATSLGSDNGGLGVERTAEELDRGLNELLSREQAEARRVSALQRLTSHLAKPRPEAPDLSLLQAVLTAAEARTQTASEQVASAEQQAALDRRVQVELTERTESLRALAQLALRHLGDACPVCGQTYDQIGTRSRLQHMLDEVHAPAGGSQLPDLPGAAAELEAAERDLSAARAVVRNAQTAVQAQAEWDNLLGPLVQEAGLKAETLTTQDTASLLDEAQSSVSSLRQLRVQGEQLSLGLARTAELAQREELEQQLAALDRAIVERQTSIDARKETGDVAAQIINALRVASSSVVGAELERIEPLLQRIFATVDPHPSLRVVSFLTKTVRGHGQMWTQLDDVSSSVSVQEPALVLSSSQLNVLAVVMYLSLNLAIPTLPLQVVALDDPLQSLDTVNLLGLADLLRRVKATRQVIVSTHDSHLADLLERKLRPVSTDQRTVRIDLRGWTLEGPSIEQADVPQDIAPLRLVVSA
ncbi:MAG: AAA family ATPase [Phycicoccus sp.]|nr:AAA family ATPase [Phycicoccus sp.]